MDQIAPEGEAFLKNDPRQSFRNGEFHKMRVITGVAESEGAGMLGTVASAR